MPRLLTNKVLDEVYRVESSPMLENIGGLTFDHGFICKAYLFNSVSRSISPIPFDVFCQFWESKHPELIISLSTFPRPTNDISQKGMKTLSLLGVD
jgi:hypothetical protein